MIEFLALLATATLFGGMVLYSFGFAPMVFRALPAEEAGRFIRMAFPWYYLFVIVASALGGVFLIPSNQLSAALMAGIAMVGLYARQILALRYAAWLLRRLELRPARHCCVCPLSVS